MQFKDRKNYHKSTKDLEKITKYTVLVIVIWTIFIGLGFIFNFNVINKNTMKIARIFGREYIRKDVQYRQWNALHNGVYGELSEITKPNPYLDIDEKNITTPSGKKLTKINPSFMTRQVHEMRERGSNITGHITSLNPIRPANKPDEWEQQALTQFHKGKSELSTIAQKDTQQVFRYMAPLYVNKSCLTCHQHQGYKIGDVRGGISVTIPMKNFSLYQKGEVRSVLLSFGFLWFTGIIIILIGKNKIKRDVINSHFLTSKIKRSEKEYRNLFENLMSGCMVLKNENSNFIILDINQKAAKIEKLKKAEVINKPIESVFNKKGDRDIINAIEFVWSTDDNLYLNDQYFNNGKKDGWRDYQIFKLETDIVVLLYNDITEQYKRKEQLKILKRSVEQSTSLIAITDTNGTIEYVNPMFCNSTGYSKEELIGKNPRILKSDEQPVEFYKDLWNTILKGDTWYGEFHNRAKSGKTFWESANISPIVNKKGKLTHFIKIGKDITERKKALESLQQSENRYRSLVESSYDAMVIFNDNGIVFFNKAFETLTSYRAEKLYNLKITELLQETEGNKEQISDSATRFDTVLQRGDGKNLQVEVIVTEIMLENKQNFFYIIRDITKQKELLQTLQKTIEDTGTLKGLIPICASCKKIRDEDKAEYVWVTPEHYIHERLPKVDFTHSICPDCVKKMYPELYNKKYKNKK